MRALASVSLKIQRFELVAASLLLVLVAIAAAIVTARLNGVGATLPCFDEWFLGTAVTGGGACSEVVRTFFELDNEEAARVVAGLTVAPLASGLLLGVGLAARELEGGTAPFVWALAASRLKWLASRIAPVVLVLSIGLVVAAVAGEALTASRQPWTVPGHSFQDPGAHGLPLVARGLAAYAVALLVGSVLGRVLPAIIVAVVVVGAMWLGGAVVQSSWLATEALRHVVPADRVVNAYTVPGGTAFQSLSRTADGSLLTDDQAAAIAPEGVDPFLWVSENFHGVYAYVPGDRYPEWSLIEVAYFGLVGLASFAAALVVLERRRPSTS